MKLLLSFKATVDLMAATGATALTWSAHNGHRGALNHLLAAGANVNHADHNRTTSLIWAAQCGHRPVVQVRWS